MHRVWFFRFKIAGIEQKVILRKFPGMSLSKARKEVVGLRPDILKGNNPAADKREVNSTLSDYSSAT